MRTVKSVFTSLLLMALGTVAVAQAKDAPAKPPKEAAAKVPKSTPAMLEKGKTAFTNTCVACHGEKGDGSGPAAVALNPKPRDFTKDLFKQGSRPEDVFATVSNGVAGTPMVGFAAAFSEEDRWGIAYYVLGMVPKVNQNKKPAAPVAAPAAK